MGLREHVPFWLRAELRRLARWPAWARDWPRLARCRQGEGRFEHLLAERRSPLNRFPETAPDRLQLGKERNVALAARRLDGVVVAPYHLFSYHWLVGRPSRLRGFREGLELHDGRSASGVGGGCCQVSNLVYLLALIGGMRVTERHRHGLDLFPDHRRTVPFGCGATVFYNYRDLRFENPLDQPVWLGLRVEDRELVGQLRSPAPVPWTVEIYEVGHRFFEREGGWMRENHIRRRFRRPDGQVVLDEEVAHNVARVCYVPRAVEEDGETEAA